MSLPEVPICYMPLPCLICNTCRMSTVLAVCVCLFVFAYNYVSRHFLFIKNSKLIRRNFNQPGGIHGKHLYHVDIASRRTHIRIF